MLITICSSLLSSVKELVSPLPFAPPWEDLLTSYHNPKTILLLVIVAVQRKKIGSPEIFSSHEMVYYGHVIDQIK